MDDERFARLVARFEAAPGAGGKPLQMHSLLVDQGEDQWVHRFSGHAGPSDIRSLSKTVLTLIAGTLAANDPDFGLETPVWDLIEPAVLRAGDGSKADDSSGPAAGNNLEAGQNLERWKKVRVKHLLNHTTGFDRVLMMRGDIKDLDPSRHLDYVVSAPLVYEPGEHYLYSNAGFYLLSAALEHYLASQASVAGRPGQDMGAARESALERYARHAFFEPLGIEDWDWEKYGDYLAGATRLWMNPEDVAKVGKLLLGEGKTPTGAPAAGTQLVEKSWIDHMRTPSKLTPWVERAENERFRRHAYGAGLWLGAEEDIFFGNGTAGQTLLVVPSSNAVVVTLANEGDVAPLERLVEEVVQSL